MAITPFKYVMDAHIFALKNFENIVRLCLLAGAISTVFTILDFGGVSLQSADENVRIMSLMTWDVVISFIVNFVLSVMFSVPYLQYAHAKSQQPDAKIRPNIQMSFAWNGYKTAYLVAGVKVLVISVITASVIMFVNTSLAIPPIISLVLFMIVMAFILRLQVMTSAAALGHDSTVMHIWNVTKGHTGVFIVLILSNAVFSMAWMVVMAIFRTTFFAVDMLGADILRVFIQTMLYYAMTLAIAHSFLSLYMAIQTQNKE